MKRLKNAPLVYVIGVVRFPPLIEPEKLAAAVFPKLRGEFPLQESVKVPNLAIEAGDQGLSIRHEEQTNWQFTSLDRKWAVNINSGVIALHTIDYKDHEDFFGRFGRCVRAAIGVPDVGIELVEAVALRYVDLIKPRHGDRLEAYLAREFLPNDLPPPMGLKVMDGVVAARYQTEGGELRVQVMRRPPTILPPELNSVLTARNGWGGSRPNGDFAVLDVDHGMAFPQPVPVGALDLAGTLTTLRGPIRAAFEATTTDHAMAYWSEDRVEE